MKTLGEGNGLATMMLGLCGLVFAAPGCDGGTTDDGGADTQTTQPAEDTGSETEGGDTEDPGETEDDGDDTGPRPEGLGCDVQPVCDKGTLEGNITLRDEASIADIQGYTHASGFILIRDSDFTCLDFLACLETARGVNIENNEVLESLDGLSALQEVLFNVTISSNPNLADVSGMTSLAKVSSDGDSVQLGARGIYIFDNASLTEVSGFDALRAVEGDISITNNENLVEISGFNNLDTIADHPNADKSPGQPQRKGGSLIVSRNRHHLERITGFTKLVVIYKNLTIQYNEVLTRLTGLYELQALGGALIITNNPKLCVSEAFRVGGDLEQGPLDLDNSSTANNDSGC